VLMQLIGSSETLCNFSIRKCEHKLALHLAVAATDVCAWFDPPL
jgi:hypothetical protein